MMSRFRWVWFIVSRFFLYVATEEEYVHPEEAVWNTVCLRDTCIYSTRFRQSRMAGKVLREMDGPIFYFAARGPGAPTIFLYYTSTCISFEYRGACIHWKVHGRKFRVPVHANQKSQTNDGMEKDVEPGCWLYQKAVDEVKYKLSLLFCAHQLSSNVAAVYFFRPSFPNSFSNFYIHITACYENDNDREK